MINYHRVNIKEFITSFIRSIYKVLETDQYWGDVSYVGVVEAQGSIIRSSSMWMVSANLLLLVQSSSFRYLTSWC